MSHRLLVFTMFTERVIESDLPYPVPEKHHPGMFGYETGTGEWVKLKLYHVMNFKNGSWKHGWDKVEPHQVPREFRAKALLLA